MSKAEETLIRLAEPVCRDCGTYVYDAEYKKEGGSYYLRLYIDKDGGVGIDDCEKVSRAIDPILDENDPIEEAYYLSVSSIGIDRPLKKDRDFERNMGKKLQVKLYAPINKKKELLGVLTGYDGESFTISVEKTGEVTIKRKDAALIRPWIDFE